jgi:hypothetical protein
MNQTTQEESKQTEEFLKTMTDIQKQALSIAKDHLGTSFDISKSNGYKKWEQDNKSTG